MPNDQLSSLICAAQKRILSVGSGDGSQQASILKSGHRNIVTTFFDSEKTVLSKYSTAKENMELLKHDGDSIVLFGVDATRLHEDARLVGQKFEIIMFTFPHTGAPNFLRSKSGPCASTINENKKLIEKFLLSAQHLLADNGEIQITLKTSAPYNSWSFPQLFGDERFDLAEKSQHKFDKRMFPGYSHRSTKGEKNGVAYVRNGNARVFVFDKKKRRSDNEVDALDIVPSYELVLVLDELTDDDITAMVLEILKGANNRNLNVLEIRRHFPEAIQPDTRQLNRILYYLLRNNKVSKEPGTKKKPNKPTWKVV